MKTKFNPLTFSYETPDGTSVAAEICEGDSPSDAFRAAAIREQQRKLLTDEEIGELYRKHNNTPGFNFEGFAKRFARAIEAAHGIKEKRND